jgi:hypothetical protein
MDFRSLRAETFKDVNLDDDRAREVVNKIDLLAETLQTKDLVSARFVSGPSVPDRRTGPGNLMMLVFSLVFGGLSQLRVGGAGLDEGAKEQTFCPVGSSSLVCRFKDCCGLMPPATGGLAQASGSWYCGQST